FADDLLEKSLLLAHAYRLANQMERHGYLDLLTAHQALEISMQQTAAEGIDLPVVEHYFAGAEAFDFQRENRIAAGIRAKNRRQVPLRGDHRYGFTLTTINRHGN